MSLASYQRNLSRKVTGPYLPTCFPAALEQVSTQYGYRSNVYYGYQDYIASLGSATGCALIEYNSDTEEAYDALFAPLGGLACADVIFKRATSPLSWMRIVKKMLREDVTVVADIHYGNRFAAHAVGLVPVLGNDHVTLVSNHIPRELSGIIPLQRVAEKMTVIPDSITYIPEYPFSDANIVGLPPLN